MSGFAQIAKTLIAQSTKTAPPPINNTGDAAQRLDHLKLLSQSGFSPQEVLRDLRELYDSCDDEEKSIRLQISKLMLQALNMLNSDEVARAAPSFTLVIQGDNNRVNSMLCPTTTLEVAQ